jgi:hypothetical protein
MQLLLAAVVVRVTAVVLVRVVLLGVGLQDKLHALSVMVLYQTVWVAIHATETLLLVGALQEAMAI